MVKVIDWRCSNGSCNGAVLAKSVNLETGWIERKCRKCGLVAHVGQARGKENVTDLRCQPFGLHKVAEASADWRGSITIACDRCNKTEATISASS